ncbi:MAG TPA: cupredoxin family copper-binding protein [Solirubrobacterales bacterium]|nr:cupredoxin family copper-binding protein [Solirubrobacterales bacterium]
MTPKALVLPVLVSLALALAACGGDGDTTETETNTTTESEPGTEPSGGSAPAPSGDAVRSAKVEIEDFAYTPDPVTIEEGGKVTWINRDSAPHTATAEDGSFDTGTLDEGKLNSESFKKAGTYAYICSIHPQMQGTVEVVGG